MCARYVLYRQAVLGGLFGAVPLDGMEPNYNIAPTDLVSAVLVRDGARRVWPLRWGLVPSWADDPSLGFKMFNARGETVAEKPSFRGPLRYRRCLIPVDGFYEWAGQKGAKQPFLISRKDGEVMAVAGLWEVWERPEGYLETCTMITTEANREIAEIHDRMPVILDREHWDLWLDPSVTEVKEILGLLRPYWDGALQLVPVSRKVNHVRAQGIELIQPADVSLDTLF